MRYILFFIDQGAQVPVEGQSGRTYTPGWTTHSDEFHGQIWETDDQAKFNEVNKDVLTHPHAPFKTYAIVLGSQESPDIHEIERLTVENGELKASLEKMDLDMAKLIASSNPPAEKPEMAEGVTNIVTADAIKAELAKTEGGKERAGAIAEALGVHVDQVKAVVQASDSIFKLASGGWVSVKDAEAA